MYRRIESFERRANGYQHAMAAVVTLENDPC